jgi:hypothetical protein
MVRGVRKDRWGTVKYRLGEGFAVGAEHDVGIMDATEHVAGVYDEAEHVVGFSDRAKRGFGETDGDSK